MVAAIEKELENRIKQLDWMGRNTKQKAVEKLHAMRKRIAFPDEWKSLEGLVFKADDYLGNMRQLSKWNYEQSVKELGQTVESKSWPVSVTSVNAAYRASYNDMIVLAGILQPPFFRSSNDDALNYGAIGVFIAHEFIHGFDDVGRQYDKHGDLHNWWAANDEKAFELKVKPLIDQFSSYRILDSIPVNGKLTLGENIADLGGMSVAYGAFSKTKQFKGSKTIDGYTPQQRFFLSYAQSMRYVAREELLSKVMPIDVHAPGEYRVNGVLTNFTPWYRAFSVTEKNRLYKPVSNRIQIW